MGNILGGGGHHYPETVVEHHHHYTTDPGLVKKNEEQKVQLEEQTSLISSLKKKVEENEIKSPNDYKEQMEKSFQQLCNVATNIPASNITNYKDFFCVAFYGKVSSGKSSFVNLLMGKKVAEIGPGEITKDITPYIATYAPLCFYDYPGNDEEISYYSADILSLARSMDLACVLFTATIKSNIRYVRLLQALKIPFVTLLTQTDLPKWTNEEIEKVKQETESLLQNYDCYRGCFAVSEEEKTKLHDTQKFIDFLLHLQAQKFPKTDLLLTFNQKKSKSKSKSCCPCHSSWIMKIKKNKKKIKKLFSF